MVEQTNSEIEALNKVHVQTDMTAWVADRNIEKDLALSNLISIIEKVAPADIDSHNATDDQCQDKNMHENYNQNSVEKIQEPYLHLPKANFFLFPQHTIVQPQTSPL